MSEEKKDYGQTLNLPKTDFPMRANLPEREPDIKKEIFDNDLYEKILKKNEGTRALYFMMDLHMQMEKFMRDML